MWVKKAERRQAPFLSVGRKNTVKRFLTLYITQAMSGTEETGDSLPKVPTCSLWQGLGPRMLVTPSVTNSATSLQTHQYGDSIPT